MKVVETKVVAGCEFGWNVECDRKFTLETDGTIWAIRQVVMGKQHLGYDTILHSGFSKGYIRKLWKTNGFLRN